MFLPDANLFESAPRRKKGASGRPRVKGKALPKPKDVVTKRKGRRLCVPWYGGGTRTVRAITGTGNWYKAGKGIVPVRWVHVEDLDGTHREEYFFSTDPTMSSRDIIAAYGGRWNIETTFQELRSHLGLETTRGWRKQTVLRMAPCLFILYTVVVLFYDAMPERTPHLRYRSWTGKEYVTFSDMIASVRHYLWIEWVFPQVPGGSAVQKLSAPVRRVLDFGLIQAA